MKVPGAGVNVAQVLMFMFVLFAAASEQRATTWVLCLQKPNLELLCQSEFYTQSPPKTTRNTNTALLHLNMKVWLSNAGSLAV